MNTASWEYISLICLYRAYTGCECDRVLNTSSRPVSRFTVNKKAQFQKQAREESKRTRTHTLRLGNIRRWEASHPTRSTSCTSNGTAPAFFARRSARNDTRGIPTFLRKGQLNRQGFFVHTHSHSQIFTRACLLDAAPSPVRLLTAACKITAHRVAFVEHVQVLRIEH